MGEDVAASVGLESAGLPQSKSQMKISNKIRAAVRDLFLPGASAFDERRQSRVVILSILGGIIIAVGFGLVLYHLNMNNRFVH